MVYSLHKYIGRSYETCNCFDLVKEMYQDFFKLDLCHYFEDSQVPERKEVESLIVSNKGDFVKVDSPVFGDIVVIKFFGIECHIGFCLDTKRFVHSARGIGSNIEKLDRYAHLIAGYYRHREVKP
jgi:hypothetical protein